MPSSERILVIEDDASLNEIVSTFLAGEGYAVTSVFSGSEARLAIDSGAADGIALVICDLMLPGMPGEALVPLVRERMGGVPVIITSAKGALESRVGMLRSGADDYLVKPFDLEELLARIEVQLRRRREGATACGGAGGGTSGAGGDAGSAGAGLEDKGPDTLHHGAWELDLAGRRFTAGGKELKLTRTEFDLVRALMENPARAFSKRDLYLAYCHDELTLADAAAGAATVTRADERTVATHVSNLRAKLRDAGAPDLIETVWGIGFKLAEA